MDDKEIQSLLFDAIQHDNDSFLHDLLEGQDGRRLLDLPDQDGNMLLHVAVLDNRPRCVECLLKHGANPNVFDTVRARTPLHLAIELGHDYIVRRFLELEHINLSLHDDRNLTCYEIAQFCDNQELADSIKARHDEINQLKDDFYTVIDKACSDNNPELVEELLEGQLQQLVTKMKKQGYHNKDHILFAQSRIKDLINWSSSSRNDVTLLFKAASKGFTKVCKILINYGATAKCNENTNYSPLYVAAYSGYTDCVKLLLDNFPTLVSEITIENWTILHACCLQGHSETARLILNYPYPEDLKRPFFNRSKIYEYKFAFDLNAQDAAGQTVIYLAVSANNEKLLDTLLQFNVEGQLIVEPTQQRLNHEKVNLKVPENSSSQLTQNSDLKSKQAQLIPDRPKVILGSYESKNNPLVSNSTQIDKIIRQLHKLDNTDTELKSHANIEGTHDSKKYLICPFDLDTYCDYNSKTALHLAVTRRYHKIATALLVNGSDPNLPILTKCSNDEQQQPGFKDLNLTSSTDTTDNSSKNEIINDHSDISSLPWLTNLRSTCLKEACLANDDVMCDILIRYGAMDTNNVALEIAASNNKNNSLVSKLLALHTNVDHEFKINKKCNVEFAARYKQNEKQSLKSLFGTVTTFSSMFPSSPVMIDWHNLKYIKRVEPQWLIEASLRHNKRLKHPTTSLMAITRLDLSNNGMKTVHPVIFRLPSLRELNLSKNRLESLCDTQHRASSDGMPTMKLIESHRIAMKRSKSANLSAINLETSNIIDLDEPQEWDLPYLEILDLHDNLLICLPDCLFELPRLRELDVSSNQIRQLPSSIWMAPSLKDMIASGNLLDDLPRMKTYTSNINNKSHAKQNLLMNNPSLEEPSDTTNESSKLLTISPGKESSLDNSTGEGPESFGSACDEYDRSFLLDLDDYSEYQLEATPITMDHLNYWERNIDLVNSHPTFWTTNNKTSGLDDDGSKDEHSIVMRTSKMMSLNLSHNSFSTIPPVLACAATSLIRLNLSYNRLQSMGEVYLYPKELKTLDLSHNQLKRWFLSDQPEKVKKLCHATCKSTDEHEFKILDCSHKIHQRFENLKSLNVSHNMLTQLNLFNEKAKYDPDRRISLVMNDTTDNSTEQQKREILAYPKVTALDLSFNKMQEVPRSISRLRDLSVLNLNGNIYINNLPPELGLANKLWNLGLNGCCLGEPLKSIIESKTYKTMDIIGYLRSILEESKPYARLKLMLVGLQGIGKTSLLEQLRQEGTSGYRRKIPEHWTKRMGHASRSNLKNQRGVNLSTVGVDIHDWTYCKRTTRNQQNLGSVSFSTWDFGGQEEFYATHRYFLSKRSLYLVVWRLTDGINGILGIQQWLVNIQSRASGSPVIIVGTHEDMVEGGEHGVKVKALQYEIQKRFINVTDYDKCGLPRIIASIVVSTKTRSNIKELCDKIYDTAFSLKCPGTSERLLEQKIPATYLYLEEIVNTIVNERHSKKEEPVLNYYDYRKLTTTLLKTRYNKTFRDLEPLNSRETNYNSELQQATRFLHENGVLLHYEDANLKDLYFLDPQWLCDILSHVVTIREINPHVKNGLMKIDDLAFLFKTIDINLNGGVKSYVVNLLNKFEVALTWNSQYLLIPSLLPTHAASITNQSINDNFHVKMAPRARGRSAVRRLESAATNKRSTSIEPSRRHSNASFVKSNQSHNVDNINNLINKDDCIRLEVEKQPMTTKNRLVLLRYLPAGFFARLQSGILSDAKFEDICGDLQMNLINHASQHSDNYEMAGILEHLENNVGNRAGWTCWKNGIRLSLQREATINSSTKVNETVIPLFAVEEFNTCSNNFITNAQRFMVECTQAATITSNMNTSRNNCDQNEDSKIDLLETKWCKLDMSEYSNILVISVYNWRLKFVKGQDKRQFMEPNQQNIAQLLALAVDHIDNLLEDWYPSLGARFAHTLGGNYLVTRIAPCLICFNETRMTYETGSLILPHHQRGSSRQSRQGRLSERINPFMTTPSSSMGLTTNPGNQHFLINKLQGNENIIIYSFYVEKCILTAYNIKSTSEADALKLRSSNNSLVSALGHFLTSSNKKTVGYDSLKCPKHGQIQLTRIVPDIVFEDVPREYKISSDQIERCKLIGRGTFGFVFRGSFRNLNHGTGVNVNQEVALKVLQPVDPGPDSDNADMMAYKLIKTNWEREPFECVCRSYCTARHEINILQTIVHPNIVLFIGISLKPLAVVLELAPLGSLADIFKSFKRSAMQIDPWSAQKTILQIAKALEFLHQQKIIYRDLKAENVLVWSFPSPFATSLNEASVEVKLADYGISRHALSTGIWKGFAGTINFLAPEILRHNGEEEYTEKVDCFSFGMFIYELLTLKPPYKQNEGLRSHLGESFRPTLTARDLTYPNYMLDLMSICWSYDPHLRPTSSQIVSIASSPEFMHLCDVIALDSTSRLSFCAAIQYDGIESSSRPLTLDLWLGRRSFKTEIISSDSNRWSDYLRLSNLDEDFDNFQATAMCIVNGRIWLADSNMMIHLMPLAARSSTSSASTKLGSNIKSTSSNYSNTHSTQDNYLNRVQTFPLDIKSCSQTLKPGINYCIEQMVHVECANCLIVRIHQQPSLFTLDLETMNMLHLIDDSSILYNCFAVQKSVHNKNQYDINQDGAQFLLFCGHSKGISCIEIRDLSVFRHKILPLNYNSFDLAGERVLDPSQSSDVIEILASEDIIWTAAGCSVHLWSLKQQSVVRKLDCWKLVPCSESLESINIESYYEQARSSRVSSMVHFNEQLCVGTTHGCFMVVEANSLKPIIVFRPYETSITIIEPMIINTTTQQQRRKIGLIEDQRQPVDADYGEIEASSVSKASYLVTIGSGYRDLMRRYVNSLNDFDTKSFNDNRQVAILWSGNYEQL